MKTSIETINGKQCTVIRKPFNAEWVREQLAMDHTVMAMHESGAKCLWDYIDHTDNISFITPMDKRYTANEFEYIYVALPALPRNLKPTPEHLQVVYLYASHGLYAATKYKSTKFTYMMYKLPQDNWSFEITHALTESGERVEVAILEDKLNT